MTAYLFIGVSMFLSFWALLDALSRPRWGYRGAGHSKALWVLLNLAGFLSMVGGLIPWAIYGFRIRRDVIRVAGRGTRRAVAVGATSTGTMADQILASAPRRPCGSCQNGRRPCYSCSGGLVRRDDGTFANCVSCGGPPGGHVCMTCHGSGYV